MVTVDQNTVVAWEGQEYVTHNRNAGWYVGLVGIGLLLVGLSVWLKWWTFTALIVVSVLALIIYTVRPPRKVHYSLSSKGLDEGDKHYNFEDFKSFGVLQDGKHFAIVLRPKKRFSASVTVYFPENQGEQIVDMFGLRLPMEEVKLDALDKIVKFLRI